ncbi:lycopene cyclase family protein [Williamsia sp. 1138]|uniref:lycopene cyclase family protein n=1 Tax=Williamsia sp. 1138 TaxID=1903117 RepID=UPI00143D724B|nr:lycopene cyclase family protein [Williamsia sp. 1138]
MTNHLVDLAVVGAGPAGRALAHRGAGVGLQIALIDPDVDARWKPTYAAWADDLPDWLDPSAIVARSQQIAVYTPARTVLDRAYVTLGTAELQQSLGLDGVTVHPHRAAVLGERSVQLDDGTVVRARNVVDARGLRDRGAPAQTAYGIVVQRSVAEPILDGAAAILMDWRGTRNDSTPTFLYVIPLDEQRVLLEETCLAAAPPMSIGELRGRLTARLGHLGLDVNDLDVLGTEKVHFALLDTARHPWEPGRPLRFGAGGGMLHPATGYSVAESLSAADDLIAAVATGDDPVRALWPWQARAVYRLRVRGLTALLNLPQEDLVGFFEAFFAAPARHRRAYLSGRDRIGGTLCAMAGTALHADTKLAGNIIRSATRSTIG